jgi:hypothetical protein
MPADWGLDKPPHQCRTSFRESEMTAGVMPLIAPPSATTRLSDPNVYAGLRAVGLLINSTKSGSNCGVELLFLGHRCRRQRRASALAASISMRWTAARQMSCEELSMSCPTQPAPGLHFDNAIVAKIDLNPVTAAVIKLATNADKYGHRHRRQARFRRLAVEPQQVVLGHAESADGRFGF